jgi:hypothetical protein
MKVLGHRHLEQERDARLVQGETTMRLESICSARAIAKDAREHREGASYAPKAIARCVGAHLDPRVTVE